VYVNAARVRRYTAAGPARLVLLVCWFSRVEKWRRLGGNTGWGKYMQEFDDDRRHGAPQLEIRPAPDGSVIFATGDLDGSSRHLLEAALDSAIAQADARIDVDMSGIDFIDSEGIGALIGGYKRAEAHGGDLRVVNPSAKVRRMFELTGLLDRLVEN
jgi:anti-anti-sigma factor